MTWLAGQVVTAQRLIDNSQRIVDYATTTSNVAGITTTEMAVVTGNTVTFRSGRAYRVTIRGLVTSSGTTSTGARFRLRKGSVSGTVIREWWDVAVSTVTAGRNVAVDLSTVISNATGADITTALVVGCLRDWGTTDSLTVSATAGTPTSLMVEDLDSATNVPGAQALS